MEDRGKDRKKRNGMSVWVPGLQAIFSSTSSIPDSQRENVLCNPTRFVSACLGKLSMPAAARWKLGAHDLHTGSGFELDSIADLMPLQQTETVRDQISGWFPRNIRSNNRSPGRAWLLRESIWISWCNVAILEMFLIFERYVRYVTHRQDPTNMLVSRKVNKESIRRFATTNKHKILIRYKIENKKLLSKSDSSLLYCVIPYCVPYCFVNNSCIIVRLNTLNTDACELKGQSQLSISLELR